MSNFINTIDSLGDIPTFKAIMDDKITEYRDDAITTLREDAFGYCANLTLIDLPTCTTISGFTFRNCTKLHDVTLPALKNVPGAGAFTGCKAIETIVLPALEGWLQVLTFSGCTALRLVDIGGALSNILNSVFQNCSALTALILRRTDAVVPLSNVTALQNTPIAKGTGYTYVPKALVEEYKVATNWSTIANQIRAIEDYPEICG